MLINGNDAAGIRNNRTKLINGSDAAGIRNNRTMLINGSNAAGIRNNTVEHYCKNQEHVFLD
jgi:hypothetical protein